nr:Tm-1-like ATP-binding domain-containing protein [Chloroflexota bacterium]
GIAQLRAGRRRDEAMEAMGRGAGQVLRRWHDAGDLGGVIAVGGNQGTAIASIAMRALPIGVPKLIVSTVASGDVRAYVADADIAMLFSVGDLLGGPNPVTGPILAKAAAALAGMAQAEAEQRRSGERRLAAVAVTAFGNTHDAVEAARERLLAAGHEVVPFHASGACGSAMERLIDEGAIEAVLDLTTHELLGERYPADIYAPVRPGRLTGAGRAGIPQVVVPGGLEYFCFGPPETIPEHLRGRPTHHHNPYNTNVRTSAEELEAVAELMADRLNAARGPVAVVIPAQGWSQVGSPGEVLHDPVANGAFVERLRRRLAARVPLTELDMTINDPRFAAIATDLLLELLAPAGASRAVVAAGRDIPMKETQR